MLVPIGFDNTKSGHEQKHARQPQRLVRWVFAVLFHPDYDRRLRNSTESADPSRWNGKALAGLKENLLTAGGELHPALRTRPDRETGQPTVRRSDTPLQPFPPAGLSDAAATT
jgi:hypothetical protein